MGFLGEAHPSLLTKWGIEDRIMTWELHYDLLEKLSNPSKKYQPIPKYPAVIEDLSLIIPVNILVGEIISTIKKFSPLVKSVDLLDSHETSRTFRKNLQEKLNVKIKK